MELSKDEKLLIKLGILKAVLRWVIISENAGDRLFEVDGIVYKLVSKKQWSVKRIVAQRKYADFSCRDIKTCEKVIAHLYSNYDNIQDDIVWLIGFKPEKEQEVLTVWRKNEKEDENKIPEDETLIERAKKAIKKKEWKLDGYHIYTLKIDVDVYLEHNEMFSWRFTREAMLTSLDFRTVDIVIDEVRNDVLERRGFHAVIHFLSRYELDDRRLNLLELLLGGDSMRYKINKRRIERGISMEQASILFSRILERYKGEKSAATLALEEILDGELK